VLLSSNDKEQTEAKKLIFTTTNTHPEGQNLPGLYVPIDPRYLYIENQHPVTNKYKMNALSTDTKAPPYGLGLDHFMHQKQEIILSKILMLNSEIYQRYSLRGQSLYHINLDQCTCRNLIYHIGEDVLDKRRIELERKIIDLEQEKRREKGNYFRDILFLRKELRESLIEKLEDKQKAGLLINQKEELPCNT